MLGRVLFRWLVHCAGRSIKQSSSRPQCHCKSLRDAGHTTNPAGLFCDMLVKAKGPVNYNADSEAERAPAGTKRNNHCQLLQCSQQPRRKIKGSQAALTIDFNGSRSASSTTKGEQSAKVLLLGAVQATAVRVL